MDEHEAAKSLLADFAAGNLRGEDSGRVQSHLDRCADCSRKAHVLRRLVRSVQRLPEGTPAPECLARIVALARARRTEVIENRRQAGLTAAAILLGWAMVFITLPLWQWFAETVRLWSGWPISTGPAAAFALGAFLSCLFLPGIWALLVRRPVSRIGEGRQ